MKLDYIENYNELNENLVRLYNFNKAEAIKFRDLLIEVVNLKKQKLILFNLEIAI